MNDKFFAGMILSFFIKDHEIWEVVIQIARICDASDFKERLQRQEPF